MYYKAKYVIIGHMQVPVVFSDLLGHDEIAHGQPVVGAGFCYIRDSRYVCYGESVSLKVKSRGDADALILNKLLGCLHED